MIRQAAVRNLRLFSTSVRVRKDPITTAKDAVKEVDRTISQGAVKGIEKGEEAVDAAKQAAGIGKDKAQEAAGEVKGKAQEAKAEADKKV